MIVLFALSFCRLPLVRSGDTAAQPREWCLLVPLAHMRKVPRPILRQLILVQCSWSSTNGVDQSLRSIRKPNGLYQPPTQSLNSPCAPGVEHDRLP